MITTCIMIAFLPLLGFIRSVVGNAPKPGYLLNPAKILQVWIADNNWKARVSPLLLIFIFLYNLFAWTVYGFTTVFDLIAYITKKISWVFMWFWHEVFHPTVFAFFRILWHYVIILGWKLFAFSCLKIPESIYDKNLIFALKKLTFLGLILGVMAIFYLLTTHVIMLVVGSLLVFYLFQYTVFSSIAFYRSSHFSPVQVFPGLKISILWLALSSVSTALLVLLTQFSYVYVVGGLGVLLIQLLLPLAALFGLAFLATTFYLPAYMEEVDDEVDMWKFLKILFLRLPKLIASQCFQFIGLIILSIVPILIILILNFGLKEVSGLNIPEWGRHVITMNYHVSSLYNLKEDLSKLRDEKLRVEFSRDSIDDIYSQQVMTVRDELEEAIQLKNKIEENTIHTFARKPYVGEFQSFSMPEINDCSDYEWIIRRCKDDRIVKKISTSTKSKPGSPVMYHRWSEPGLYTITIRTKQPCVDDIEKSIDIEVIELPGFAESADASSTTESMHLPEQKYFVNREAANYAIDILNNQLQDFQNEKRLATRTYDKVYHLLTDRINHMQFQANEHIGMLISKILGIFGLVFMGVFLLTFSWQYWLTYHYDMFDFEQSGKHYWIRLLEELKAKNSNQPLLGLFVLLVLFIVGICCVFLMPVFASIVTSFLS